MPNVKQKKLREDKTEEEQREEQLPPPDPHTTDSVMNGPVPPAGSLFGPPLEMPAAEKVLAKKATPREIAAQEMAAQQFAANRIMPKGKSQGAAVPIAKALGPSPLTTGPIVKATGPALRCLKKRFLNSICPASR